MTNQLSVFNLRSTEVRTVAINGEAWFVASDIAKALQYRTADDMTRMLDDDEKGTHIVRTPSGDQEMIVINESGMFHAALKSRKPEAKPFRKWVTSEVLPAIRKTGKYQAATVDAESEPKKIGPAVISDYLQIHINRKTHEIALGQYDSIRGIITEAVQGNLNCGATEASCHDTIDLYGDAASEVTVINKRDLFMLASKTTQLLNSAGDALEIIHRLEKHLGREIYVRKVPGQFGCYGLPESLVEQVLSAAQERKTA